MVESCFLAKKEKTFDFSKVFILVRLSEKREKEEEKKEVYRREKI